MQGDRGRVGAELRYFAPEPARLACCLRAGLLDDPRVAPYTLPAILERCAFLLVRVHAHSKLHRLELFI